MQPYIERRNKMNGIEIKYENNQMLVSSLEVAKNFGKEHKNVLQTIGNLVAENSATKSMIYETSYKNRGRQYPMYYMNRDGFSLLVMGFTGKEALEWKMKYIQAFNEMEQKLNNPEFLVQRTMEYLKSRCDALLLENKVQSQQIAELKPKASYYDVVLNCKDLLSISVIAKDYGWSAIRLNEYLHKKGVQFKQGKTWLLYQKYAVEGYTSTKTHEHLGNDGKNHTNVHTYWTQKGRLFIYDLLKSDGIVPLIERDENG